MVFMLVIIFTPLFLECSEDDHKWNLVGVANNGEQGTTDRIRKKIEKIKHLARKAAKLTAASQQVSSNDRDEVQCSREAFQERERELQQQVKEANQRVEDAQQQIQTAQVRTDGSIFSPYM